MPEPMDRIPTLPNLRDVGGWPTTTGGQVRRGQLYRSVELGRLDHDGLDAFARLGVRTVFDLRTRAEREAQPDRVPEGTSVVSLDVLADEADAAPAQLMALLQDPVRATEELGGDRAVALFERGYRKIVSLPSALAGYRAFYTALGDPGNRPALVHCTTGKDRTGWGASALLTLLGVGEADVLRDYLLTNDELLPALQPVFDRFASAGGDPQVLMPLLGVRREYLLAALEEMTTRFGSIEGYFAEGLGIDADGQNRLREAFVAPSPVSD